MSITYLNQIKYKDNNDIKLQFLSKEALYVITQSPDLSWTLYNHTQNKKIGSSRDLIKLLEKIPNYFKKGGE